MSLMLGMLLRVLRVPVPLIRLENMCTSHRWGGDSSKALERKTIRCMCVVEGKAKAKVKGNLTME